VQCHSVGIGYPTLRVFSRLKLLGFLQADRQAGKQAGTSDLRGWVVGLESTRVLGIPLQFRYPIVALPVRYSTSLRELT